MLRHLAYIDDLIRVVGLALAVESIDSSATHLLLPDGFNEWGRGGSWIFQVVNHRLTLAFDGLLDLSVGVLKAARSVGVVEHILLYVVHVLFVEQVGLPLFHNTALGPHERSNPLTEDRQFDLVLNEVRSFRHLNQNSISESLTKLPDESPLDLILSLGPLVVSILSGDELGWLECAILSNATLVQGQV